MLDLTLVTLQTPAVNHPRQDLLSDNAVTVMNFHCVCECECARMYASMCV